MQITIHRGIKQVGGCITEISTHTTRIFIDMGDNLPGNGTPLTDNERAKLVSDLFQQNRRDNEAVFYTHGHSDHVGMMNFVPPYVTQYMSQGTNDVLRIKQEVLAQRNEINKEMNEYDKACMKTSSIKKTMDILASCITWQKPKPKKAPETICFGDIKVTPYFVSHSIYDANMLLIEADGKTILHTGDYRGHGYLSKGLFPTLQTYIHQVDYLITEGTMLGREDICETERTISARMSHVMAAFRYVFVLVSSTDIERLAAINRAAKEQNRIMVSCALIYHKLLNYFKEKASLKDGDLFDFKYEKYPLNIEKKGLIKAMQRKGFVMLIGASHGERVKQIMQHFDPAQTLLIYSSWDGYYKLPEQVAENPTYKEMRALFNNVVDIHTAGHADNATIAKVITSVNPREGIIGIHKDANTSLTSLDLPDELNAKIIPENKQPNCITLKY